LGISLLVAGLLATLPHEHQLAVSATVRSTVLAPVFEVQQWVADMRLTNARVRELRAERDSLAARLLELEGLALENQRLREVVGVPQRIRSHFRPANLYPTGRPGEMLQRSFILDIGSEDAVAPEAAVVAPDGLVGVVRATTERQSAGDFWTHPDFRVSAMTTDGEVFGIIHARSGHPAWMELEGVPYQAELESGTPLVTSGLGGVFPRGIPVGSVSRLIGAEVGWAKSYLVTPAVYPEGVREVMVLVDSATASGDVSDAWLPAPPQGEPRP
jgi:rod shape-determining protein MreC